MAKDKKYTYTDLDLNFTRHPGTGDVMRVFDLEAVMNSMKNIIQGKPFEKPFDEFYGTTIRDMLFTLYSPMTEIIVKRILKEKIELYEPRVTINNVTINNDNSEGATNIDRNQLTVEIHFNVYKLGNQVLRLEMERLR